MCRPLPLIGSVEPEKTMKRTQKKRTKPKKVGRSPPIQLALVSDGRGVDTRVIDIVSGRELSRCYAVKWKTSPEKFAEMTIKVSTVPSVIAGWKWDRKKGVVAKGRQKRSR